MSMDCIHIQEKVNIKQIGKTKRTKKITSKHRWRITTATTMCYYSSLRSQSGENTGSCHVFKACAGVLGERSPAEPWADWPRHQVTCLGPCRSPRSSWALAASLFPPRLPVSWAGSSRLQQTLRKLRGPRPVGDPGWFLLHLMGSPGHRTLRHRKTIWLLPRPPPSCLF